MAGARCGWYSEFLSAARLSGCCQLQGSRTNEKSRSNESSGKVPGIGWGGERRPPKSLSDSRLLVCRRPNSAGRFIAIRASNPQRSGSARFDFGEISNKKQADDRDMRNMRRSRDGKQSGG
jgi:hypothetical protein